MQIYFSASIIGKRTYLTNYKKIVELISTSGNQIYSDHVLETTEKQIHTESENDRRNYHEKMKTRITTSNCVIAEVSFPSTGVGFEISYALAHKKPILLLYKLHSTPPSLFEHYSDDLLICEAYTEKSLPIIIEDFLNYVKGGHDRRFTFSLTPKISAFLEKKVQTQNIPKSVYIRQLLEREIEKTS